MGSSRFGRISARLVHDVMIGSNRGRGITAADGVRDDDDDGKLEDDNVDDVALNDDDDDDKNDGGNGDNCGTARVVDVVAVTAGSWEDDADDDVDDENDSADVGEVELPYSILHAPFNMSSSSSGSMA